MSRDLSQIRECLTRRTVVSNLRLGQGLWQATWKWGAVRIALSKMVPFFDGGNPWPDGMIEIQGKWDGWEASRLLREEIERKSFFSFPDRCTYA
jgi:hypothetical protein